jgi:NADPH:quinone reductase-like Zn-dependent oxidoreductase
VRAVRIEQFGTRPFLADMPEPNIVEGESLVQVRAASVGPRDVTIAIGRFGVFGRVVVQP